MGHGIGHLIAVTTSVTCEAHCASTPGAGLKPRTRAQRLKWSGQLHGGQIWSVHTQFPLSFFFFLILGIDFLPSSFVPTPFLIPSPSCTCHSFIRRPCPTYPNTHTGTYMHMNRDRACGAVGHGDPREGLRGKTTVFS